MLVSKNEHCAFTSEAWFFSNAFSLHCTWKKRRTSQTYDPPQIIRTVIIINVVGIFLDVAYLILLFVLSLIHCGMGRFILER